MECLLTYNNTGNFIWNVNGMHIWNVELSQNSPGLHSYHYKVGSHEMEEHND